MINLFNLKIKNIVIGSFFALLLTACGGGGSSGGGIFSPPEPPIQGLETPTIQRSDLYFGYYGSGFNQAQETGSHVNLFMTFGWSGGNDFASGIINDLTEARIANIEHTAIGLPAAVLFDLDDNALKVTLRDIFSRARALNLLSNVVMIYPIDEPDILSQGARTDEAMHAKITVVRSVMSEFQELNRTKLGVFYACGSGSMPGFDSFDMIGCDDYDAREKVLGAPLERIKSRFTRPSQCAMIIPGGADVWNQDPTLFYNKAQNDPKVCALVGFIWFDGWDSASPNKKGIKSRLPREYCIVGKKIKNPGIPSPTC